MIIRTSSIYSQNFTGSFEILRIKIVKNVQT